MTEADKILALRMDHPSGHPITTSLGGLRLGWSRFRLCLFTRFEALEIRFPSASLFVLVPITAHKEDNF